MDPEVEPLLAQRPPKKTGSKSTLWTTCPYILGNEFCERLAFNGLAANLVTYVAQVMGGDPAFAAILVFLFEGTCYLTPVLGAIVADSFLGRYKTILVFSSIYFVGMVMLALTSFLPGLTPPHDGEGTALYEASSWQYATFFTALGVVAVGTGGIKPNVSAFGADQFDERDPRDKEEKASFFNYFYLAINVGSLIACTVIVYIQDQGHWATAFFIVAFAMFLAVLFFVCGSGRYHHVLPTESPMVRVFKVCAAAIRNQLRRKRARTAAVGNGHAYNEGLLDEEDMPNGSHHQDAPPSLRKSSTKSFTWLENAVDEWHQTGTRSHGFTENQVMEVRLVLRMMPVFFSTVLYWTIYGQMASMFVQEGNLMNKEVYLGQWHFSLPSASMALFNTASIIVLIPLYDRVLEPTLKKAGKKITLLQRIGWGMVIAVLAMVLAAGLEMYRLHQASMSLAPPNILWQAPQYILVGASEVLTSIGQLEFFYDQAPDVMRSASMALGLTSTAVGSYLGAALVCLVTLVTSKLGACWLPRDLNRGRLDLFFLFLAVLMAVNLIIYCWMAVNYEYKAVTHKVVRIITTPQQGPGPSLPPLPPLPPRAPTANVDIGATRRTQVFYDPRQDPNSPSPSPYSRSLAYFPPSPALPAPFR